MRSSCCMGIILRCAFFAVISAIYLFAQAPPLDVRYKTLPNHVFSIDGSIQVAAPDGWSTKRVAFGARHELGMGDGFICTVIVPNNTKRDSGYSVCRFLFQIYTNCSESCILDLWKTRKLNPLLQMPYWSPFTIVKLNSQTGSFCVNRRDYVPEGKSVLPRTFSDQVYVSMVNSHAVLAYFYGGKTPEYQLECFTMLIDILKQGYSFRDPIVKSIISNSEIDSTQPKDIESALLFMDRHMSNCEKLAIYSYYNKTSKWITVAPFVDGSRFSPYLAACKEGHVAWDEWMALHWGLYTGDSPLARSLELEGCSSPGEMISKLFDRYYSRFLVQMKETPKTK